ncbi:MAG: hypothetical protein ACI4OG_02765 [Bacilli bacterium]
MIYNGIENFKIYFPVSEQSIEEIKLIMDSNKFDGLCLSVNALNNQFFLQKPNWYIWNEVSDLTYAVDKTNLNDFLEKINDIKKRFTIILAMENIFDKADDDLMLLFDFLNDSEKLNFNYIINNCFYKPQNTDPKKMLNILDNFNQVDIAYTESCNYEFKAMGEFKYSIFSSDTYLSNMIYQINNNKKIIFPCINRLDSIKLSNLLNLNFENQFNILKKVTNWDDQSIENYLNYPYKSYKKGDISLISENPENIVLKKGLLN